MMRKTIVAANWKMNLTLSQTLDLARQISENIVPNMDCEVILFPSFLHLSPTAELIRGRGVGLGGQNLCFEEKGAYTGEIAAFQLKDVGCSHVLIGHSERRHYFQENYETVNIKIKRALDAGLKVMLCVGESLEAKENEISEMVIVDQIESALEKIPESKLGGISIAYEPIWAIGTGNTVTAADASRIHQLIRKTLTRLYDKDHACSMKILYGGSVNQDNIAELLKEDDVDGVLVGGASLKLESFLAIMQSAVKME